MLDRRMCKVVRGNREVPMTPSEYRLPEVFLEKPRQVLSRSYLLDHIWGAGVEHDERTRSMLTGSLAKLAREGK